MNESNDPRSSADARTGSGVGPSESLLERDDLFAALADRRRRYLLYTLIEDGGRSIGEIARRIAAWENDVPASAVGDEEAERVYASLYHAHVPKLEDFGIVGFDRRDETVARGPNADVVLEVLEQSGASDAEELERHARRDEGEEDD